MRRFLALIVLCLAASLVVTVPSEEAEAGKREFRCDRAHPQYWLGLDQVPFNARLARIDLHAKFCYATRAHSKPVGTVLRSKSRLRISFDINSVGTMYGLRLGTNRQFTAQGGSRWQHPVGRWNWARQCAGVKGVTVCDATMEWQHSVRYTSPYLLKRSNGIKKWEFKVAIGNGFWDQKLRIYNTP